MIKRRLCALSVLVVLIALSTSSGLARDLTFEDRVQAQDMHRVIIDLSA